MTTGTRLSAIGASAAAALLLLLGSAAAAPGDLDPTFGNDGIADAPIGTAVLATAMALQPDGKIVLAGYGNPWAFALTRYTPDGRLDSGFGTGGTAAGPAGSATGVAIQSDGKIVVTGYSGDGLMSVLRYTASGSIDTAFGSGGSAKGPQGAASAVAVQADGKIVVVGTSVDPGPSVPAITLLRFRADGAPDAGFGSNGIVRTPIGQGSVARDLALQPDGKIVAAGGSDAMTLVRYETDGRLDQAFGSRGIARVTAGGSTSAESVVLEPNGRIVAAGYAGLRLAVARLLPDGRPDPSFGTGGATTTGTGGIQGASDVALQADGRIVVAAGGPHVVTLVRVRADGSLDPDFGQEGISTSAFGSWSEARAVAVQPDGRVLAAGFRSGESETHFLLARFRVTSPTTIAADPVVVPLGTRLRLSGTAVDPRQGAQVQILARGCYAHATTRTRTTREQLNGTWSALVTPRTRMAYRAEILGDRSVSVTVQVRPRVTLRRLSRSRVRVRVLFGRPLTGEVIALQRFRPTTGWTNLAVTELQQAGRARDGVLSGATFKARPGGGSLRALLRQPNQYACYADAFSRPIPR